MYDRKEANTDDKPDEAFAMMLVVNALWLSYRRCTQRHRRLWSRVKLDFACPLLQPLSVKTTRNLEFKTTRSFSWRATRAVVPSLEHLLFVMNILFMMEFTNSRSKSCEFPLRLFRLMRSWRQNLQSKLTPHNSSLANL